ncbi:hypothetical protein [Prosthecomicrobium pneumaticum]|uniref:Uncharacterized protein n=1 Tax=Prosthecomicrobium pneumaticum TaxID=81895 RepID=A0A7W9CU82_9HYPH|nr:hypothetical protein [Prosthecomicrobium pneumaticum]MBB5751653.1 hypothetical protein [Prosthecomicrobium pneumaticum]
MQLSMWSYPWDLDDLGIDRAVADLSGTAGLNTISLATSYHAGRFLQPRSPLRKAYFPEDGTIYFKPDPAAWEGVRIVPQVASIVERRDVLRELVERRDAGGMAVSCWTVCLHNTRIGMLYPQAVTRNAFGDPNYYNLCPSHPDARAYVRALVADVTRAYRPDVIELESPCFMGFAHEYHHEKDGVGMTAEDDFLLSLCFCDACLARAGAAGVDGTKARATVRRWIVEACERDYPAPRFPDFPAGGLDVFRGHPEVHDYLMWRFEPVTSLVAEIRDVADPATKVYLIDLKDGWLGGCDLAAIGAACDGAILCAYFMDAPATEALMRAGRAALGPEKYLGAGFRVFYPEMPGPEELARRSAAAIAGGATGINYYNYGLIPEQRLAWVGAAVDAIGGR